MQISSGIESLDEAAIAGELSEDTQFNLRVVSDYQLSSHRVTAEATPVFGSMRHLLNVGVGAGKPASGRADLAKVSVQAAGRRVDQLDHVLTIAGQCLLHGAVFQQCGYHRILGCKRLQLPIAGGFGHRYAESLKCLR